MSSLVHLNRELRNSESVCVTFSKSFRILVKNFLSKVLNEGSPKCTTWIIMAKVWTMTGLWKVLNESKSGCTKGSNFSSSSSLEWTVFLLFYSLSSPDKISPCCFKVFLRVYMPKCAKTRPQISYVFLSY
jgi:hypothetical protein